MDIIKGQLKSICETEKLVVDEEALFAIARAAQGGMRDALGILDQLAAGGAKVTLADANGLLGLIDVKYIFDLAGAIIAKDGATAMSCIETVINAGKDERRLLRDMVEHFRNIMLMKIDAEKLQSLVDYPVYYRKQLLEQATQLSLDSILKVMDILIASKDTERLTNAPRLALELAITQSIIVLLPVQASAVPVAPAAPMKPTATAAPAPKPAPAMAPRPAAVKPAIPAAKPAPSAPTAPKASVTPTNTAAVPAKFSLASVKNLWSEMTAAVQAEKTYLGTYLLEGAPVAVNGQTLTVAFTPDFVYHKECLEETAAMKLVAEVFSKLLGHDILLNFTVMDNIPQEKSAHLQHALEAFEGEVVNEWHTQ
jgi:DNA polymerase-3 subunit gamma/tau